ncbi:hypothetical protein I5E68_14285 [Novosphingobium sp. YJ-S2-02]|uniref:Uncharacterized protein n=1 Tax=Novosphingobium aureum TaxID=2792964 RepID=A0A931HE55_9SPHN|nr:hypothetical protein [Novosphingobium aureum]MBH0114109.1 hypothetical protein [Novosphingobium aureum]
MIRYHPIDIGFPVASVDSDLVCFHWQNMAADFVIPGDENHLLRISFDSDAIVRILDEMPLSTESDPATWEGLVPYHFAYRVEGAAFVEQQSPSWREIVGPVTHFQFVTGSACLDVLTPGTPTFALIPDTQATSS